MILIVFTSHHSYEALFQLMNEELSHVNHLFALNKLSLNLKKTNYILFRSHRKPTPSNTLTLHINNVEIPKVSSTKFVGILVNQFLTWSDHISNITSKIIIHDHKMVPAISLTSYSSLSAIAPVTTLVPDGRLF